MCRLSLICCACYLFFLFYWANDCVSKNKGDDTTTRTEIETAGSGKDLGFCVVFWLWPLGAGRCKHFVLLIGTSWSISLQLFPA